eukprot:evm.model.scf_42.10 EVM.evm.TU.scf_42.10   scf_42:70307-73002(+)
MEQARCPEQIASPSGGAGGEDGVMLENDVADGRACGARVDAGDSWVEGARRRTAGEMRLWARCQKIHPSTPSASDGTLTQSQPKAKLEDQFCQPAAPESGPTTQAAPALDILRQLMRRVGQVPVPPSPRAAQQSQPMAAGGFPEANGESGAYFNLEAWNNLQKKVKKIRTSVGTASKTEPLPLSPTLSLPDSLDTWLPGSGMRNSGLRTAESPHRFQCGTDGRLWSLDSNWNSGSKDKHTPSEPPTPTSGTPEGRNFLPGPSVVQGEWNSLAAAPLLPEGSCATSLVTLGRSGRARSITVCDPSPDASGARATPPMGTADEMEGGSATPQEVLESQDRKEKRSVKRKRSAAMRGERNSRVRATET